MKGGKEGRSKDRKMEVAWLGGQSWGFEYGRPGFESPTWTTE